MYYSEKNVKAQSASTLHNFPKICVYQSNFYGCAMLVGTSSKRTSEFCPFPSGLPHHGFYFLTVFTLLHTHMGKYFPRQHGFAS